MEMEKGHLKGHPKDFDTPVVVMSSLMTLGLRDPRGLALFCHLLLVPDGAVLHT